MTNTRRSRRVLVIEDDAEAAASLASCLGSGGYSVDIAADGDDLGVGDFCSGTGSHARKSGGVSTRFARDAARGATPTGLIFKVQV